MVDPVRERPVEPVDQTPAADPAQAEIDRAVSSANPNDGLDLLRTRPDLAPQIADAALRQGNFSLAHAAQNTAPANDPIGSLSPVLTGTGFGLTSAGQVGPIAPVTLAAANTPPLSTIPMLSQYGGEHLPGNTVWDPASWGTNGVVRYLTPEESAARRVTVGADGKLYDASGKLFDTSRTMPHNGTPGRAIFVMDQHGGIYPSLGTEAHPSQFHHSSLLASRDVAMAGEIEVRNGQLRYISNQSGHYQPPNAMLEQGNNFLKAQGVDFSQATVEPSRFPPSTKPRLAPQAAPITPEGRPVVTPPVVDPNAPRTAAPVVDPAAPRVSGVDPAAPRVPVGAVDPAVARATQIADVAGKVGRPLVVVGAAVDAYNLYHAENKVEEGSRIAGGWAGAWAGGAMGAKGGAVVGTFIGGPVGTVVGGIVGGVVGGVAGYLAGTEVGQAAYNVLKEPVGAAIDGVKSAWNSLFG